MERKTQSHTFPPFYREDSRVLIMGSFPSVKSRELGFYYGHPRNRFWKVLATVFQDQEPISIPEKELFLECHQIALWDVIASCDIAGSSDSSIRDVIPNDLTQVLPQTKIRRILTNGGTADQLYRKYLEQQSGIKAIQLPSTSPANAAWTIDKLVEKWSMPIHF